MTRIGILAGGGRLPLMIAESVAQRGGRVHIVAIEGEADPEVARYPHTWVNLGQVGRMVSILRAEGDELVIAGRVTRPDLRKLKPDRGFFTSLPQVLGLMAGGDDSVLSRVVRFFEQKGLRVRGAHEVAPDLLAGAGQIGAVALPEPAFADARLAAAVRRALGPLDAGQAVVVAGGQVLAIEGAEGTDAMLQRVAGLRRGSETRERGGVLGKGPKPGQELRVDMPAVGPRTIEGAAAAGLAGLAVQAGGVLVLDRREAIAMADTLGVAVHGFEAGETAAAHTARPASGRRVGRVIGRKRPSRREAADIEKGLAAVDRLAPFGTGGACVVARAYILAIDAAEGVSPLLQRVGALRQWGHRGKRRVGVLVRRIDPPGSLEESAPERLLAEAAAQGLAGVAVAGPTAALAPYGQAARHADRLDLFLVTCESG
jgi:lipid-A-disaccharide synthase